MGVRSFLNRHPAATVSVVVLLTALAVASIVLQLRPSGELPLVPPKDVYTTDDGDNTEHEFADDHSGQHSGDTSDSTGSGTSDDVLPQT